MEQIEDRFLGALGEDALKYDVAVGCIKEAAGQGQLERAEEWASMLQGELSERKDVENGLALLLLRAEINGETGKFRHEAAAAAEKLSDDRNWPAFTASCGFDRQIPVGECLRRLDNLRKMAPGAICIEKGWGFGTIRQIDEFYRKVTVDFRKKTGHQMSFAYAAESLSFPGPEHILVRFHENSAAMGEMAGSAPGEIIKLVLASYGPMDIAAIRALLADNGIVADEAWKAFWESARKALKKDPFVDVPARKSEPLRLLESEKSFDAGWFERLAGERDLARVVESIEEIAASDNVAAPDQKRDAVLRDRMEFALKGASGMHPDLLARLYVISDVKSMEGIVPDMGWVRDSLLDPVNFADIAKKLPVKIIRAAVALLIRQEAGRAVPAWTENLDRLPFQVVSEILDALLKNGYAVNIERLLAGIAATGKASPVMTLWIARNIDLGIVGKFVALPEALELMTDVLEGALEGEELKAQKGIRAILENRKWVEDTVSRLDESGRRRFLVRVNGADGWNIVERRSLLAKLVKIDPSLEKDLAVEPEEKERHLKLTSWRSYRDRVEQLRRLGEEEIPANSREIALARSYGDLSENHEYKAAKEMQGILLKRQGELEIDLKTVQATDFTGFAFDQSGPGTQVAVKFSNGDRITYYVLGEWDRDEGMNIVSSRSRLGEALSGKKAGDTVEIPAENGAVEGTIEEIDRLPAQILEWAK